jgi:hypothetical protein
MNTLSKRNSFVGTLHWMAPEAILEREYDERADIWSLGITVIELAQLVPPNYDMHPARLLFYIPKEAPPKLDQPELWSPQMNRFLARCLVKDHELRPTASELLNDPWIISGSRSASADDLKQLLLDYVAKKAMNDREGSVQGPTTEVMNSRKSTLNTVDREARGYSDKGGEGRNSSSPQRQAVLAQEGKANEQGAVPSRTSSIQARGPGGVAGEGDDESDPTFLELNDAEVKAKQQAARVSGTPATGEGGSPSFATDAQYRMGIASAGLERHVVDLPLLSLNDVTLEELSSRYHLNSSGANAGAGLSGKGQKLSDIVMSLTHKVYVGGTNVQQQHAQASAAGAAPSSSQVPAGSRGGAGNPGGMGPAGSSLLGGGPSGPGDSSANVNLPKHITYATTSLLRSFHHHSEAVYSRGLSAEAIENSVALSQRYGTLLKVSLQI